MKLSKWNAVAGATCLVAGSAGQLAQYLVSPIGQGQSAEQQVADAAADLPAVNVAIWLDLLILLLIPASIYAGAIAGGTRSWLASAGTALIVVGSLGAGYLLGADVLVSAAASSPDRPATTGLVESYSGSGPMAVVVGLFLIGHMVGFVLLGIALIRSRAIPAWAGIALVIFPVAELVGEASGMKGVAATGMALLVVGYGACAGALLRAAWLNSAARLTVPASRAPITANGV